MSQAAKDVEASQEVLVDLFERIEFFFKRLESYTAVRPTDAMTDIIVKIMVEVLDIFAIATKEMKQSRASAFSSSWRYYNCSLICILEKYLKKLVGGNEIENALKRLDKLTQEEARMAAAENLRLAQIVERNVTKVMNGTSTTGSLFPARFMLKTHALVRRTRNEGSNPTIGKQCR